MFKFPTEKYNTESVGKSRVISVMTTFLTTPLVVSVAAVVGSISNTISSSNSNKNKDKNKTPLVIYCFLCGYFPYLRNRNAEIGKFVFVNKQTPFRSPLKRGNLIINHQSGFPFLPVRIGLVVVVEVVLVQRVIAVVSVVLVSVALVEKMELIKQLLCDLRINSQTY